ncbi:hypothetical protein AVEN_207783-1 [Araneus ventricosus]|uniref:Uncharacterized protein n=1 Tax=Araneus ventricosus TaxID=182803 RepID=A0A4Y2BXG0_ARAVE|nr:hypothetical protein AVEN_207783-1 [Araneus ventricosus]
MEGLLSLISPKGVLNDHSRPTAFSLLRTVSHPISMEAWPVTSRSQSVKMVHVSWWLQPGRTSVSWILQRSPFIEAPRALSLTPRENVHGGNLKIECWFGASFSSDHRLVR